MSASPASCQGAAMWANTPPHTAHANAATPVAAEANEDGVVVRSMRLKVLYTFDDQNKTNCLARWPDILQIKTVSIDEVTAIGIIELKTCLQAIVQCSPELMARIGTDYTIYAYDYSEYDTPLVGQGMLSKAMRAASPTPNTPASESCQLITGRICKNILGIFTNGVKETLEVKLRLVPVPKAVEAQYLDNMREMSKSVPAGLEATEWSAFMQQNPAMVQMATRATPTPSLNTNQRDGVSMEVVNQLLSPQIQQQMTPDPCQQPSMNGATSETGTTPGNSKKTSRPSSRASIKRPRARKPKVATVGGNTSGYEEGTDGDEGPAPKRRRAKVTKANQKNSNAFTTAPDSLRVAASTAGSLRMFRPIAPSAGPPGTIAHLQEFARAPTPVPIMPNQHIPRDHAPSQSFLRRDSFAAQSQHISPYPRLQRPEDELRNSIESANPSPERNVSPADTPQEMASSPPVMRTRPVTPATMRSSPPCPSSPVLPQMPRTDSGFMSGSLDDLFEEDDELNIDPELENYQNPLLTEPTPRIYFPDDFAIEEVMPGPAELLPTRMPIVADPSAVSAKARSAISRAGSVLSEDGQSLPPLKKGRSATRKKNRAPSKEKYVQTQTPLQPPVGAPSPGDSLPIDPTNQPPQQSETTQMTESNPPPQHSSRTMARTASVGSLTLPTIPASDPIVPPSGLHRSHTWSETPQPGLEYPIMQLQEMVPQTEASANSMAKKAAIRQKLEDAIKTGKMPPFCSNCGAISTPTWRKAWAQEHQGAPGYYDYSDEPGRVTAIVVLTRDTESKPTSYLLIKKFLLPTESQDGFNEFLLCNPCGIWLSKYKTQRPESRWENNAQQGGSRGGGGPRKPRASKAKKGNSTGMMMSEGNFPPSEINQPYSEANFPQSEAYYPQSEAMGPPESTSFTEGANTIHQDVLPDQNRRENTARPAKRINAMTSDAASAALRRAIQSSPARWAGTRQSPIEVEEDDMGDTRRLLFPSPRKDGSPKVLGEVVANIVSVARVSVSPKEAIFKAQNKENCPPTFDEIDIDPELLRMFEEEIAKGEPVRPTTPVRDSPARNDFKTPTRPTPNHRPVTRSVSRSQRSGKSPGQILTFNKTPSRTPVRRSPRFNDGVFESPFTRTLNQMMAEANDNSISPSRQIDFSNMPDLTSLHPQSNVDLDFSLEDFFTNDAPISSSQTQSFNLYEDTVAMEHVDWSDFGSFPANPLQGDVQVESGVEIVVKTEEECPLNTEDGKEAKEGAA